ncbi:MAG: lipopolysaccharide biosynthesis protein [Bacteroidota bacterium]|nr:lipopolysaccharide biosynthesis protein [Bacteroidota bacterium]
MEFDNFLKVLLRYKKTLILVPLISGVVTFFLVRNLPKTYKSTSRIATGLVERSDEFINKNILMDSKISQEFSNIIQMMLLKKVVNQVSYQLMVHDLLPNVTPYRKQSSLVENLTDAQRKHAIDVFKSKYQNMQELYLFDKDQSDLNKLLISKKYDYESLTDKMNIYRLQTSDYIYLDFESENPMLSAVVLNTLSKEFIGYYTSIVNQRKEKTVVYLDSLLKVKQSSLNGKINTLKNYKIKNNILDVNNQANVLMGQIADFQSKRQEALKNITAYSSVLENINANLKPDEKNSLEGSLTKSNQAIIQTRSRLNALNDEYIKNDFDPKYKARIDSLQNALALSINDASNKVTYNTSTAKQDLIKEKMNTEINLEMARNSVTSLNDMVTTLTGKLHVLAPNQANIQDYEASIEIEGKEYQDLVNKFNQTKLESSFPIQLRQVEMAMPEVAEPSKKILLVFLAAIVSFLFTVGVVFVMYYVDHTVNNSQELADSTQQPVLGNVSLIKGAIINPEELWNKSNDTPILKRFKGQLRSVRFEIDNDLGDSKVIAFTSLQPAEGKSFLTFNLAYAYKIINKKVLLIDGNFDKPDISEIFSPDLFLEDFLPSMQDINTIPQLNKNFVVIGNKGEDVSLLEISNHASVQSKMESLRNKFDIILIEIPSLNSFNKAREWVSFSDKIISVFSAGQSIDKENKKQILYLGSLKSKLAGWVINKVSHGKEKSEKSKASKKGYA